jgi:hypothetical protein
MLATEIPNGPDIFVYTLSGFIRLTVMEPVLLSSGVSILMVPYEFRDFSLWELRFTLFFKSSTDILSGAFVCDAVHE